MPQFKKSLSPFIPEPQKHEVFSQLEKLVRAAFGEPPEEIREMGFPLRFLADAKILPVVLRKIWTAPSHDCPQLIPLCDYLIRFRTQWEEFHLVSPLLEAMEELFRKKTDLFLIDHHDRSRSEQMGWPDNYRDVILFSKERDILVGQFFSPFHEHQPGLFSEFVTRWSESTHPDRLLHLLDFCAASKTLSLEGYLLLTHPALRRLITNKSTLRTLFDKVNPVLPKLPSPTWEKDVRLALGL